MAISNTQRTLKYFRDQGIDIDIVERFLSYASKFGKRRDLFGIIDLIAVDGSDIIGIQSCGQNFAEHDRTILNSPMSKKWLKAARLILIGWRRVKKKRGSKAMVWKPRIKEYTLGDFNE